MLTLLRYARVSRSNCMNSSATREGQGGPQVVGVADLARHDHRGALQELGTVHAGRSRRDGPRRGIAAGPTHVIECECKSTRGNDPGRMALESFRRPICRERAGGTARVITRFSRVGGPGARRSVDLSRAAVYVMVLRGLQAGVAAATKQGFRECREVLENLAVTQRVNA